MQSQISDNRTRTRIKWTHQAAEFTAYIMRINSSHHVRPCTQTKRYWWGKVMVSSTSSALWPRHFLQEYTRQGTARLEITIHAPQGEMISCRQTLRAYRWEMEFFVTQANLFRWKWLRVALITSTHSPTGCAGLLLLGHMVMACSMCTSCQPELGHASCAPFQTTNWDGAVTWIKKTDRFHHQFSQWVRTLISSNSRRHILCSKKKNLNNKFLFCRRNCLSSYVS